MPSDNRQTLWDSGVRLERRNDGVERIDNSSTRDVTRDAVPVVGAGLRQLHNKISSGVINAKQIDASLFTYEEVIDE